MCVCSHIRPIKLILIKQRLLNMVVAVKKKKKKPTKAKRWMPHTRVELGRSTPQFRNECHVFSIQTNMKYGLSEL